MQIIDARAKELTAICRNSIADPGPMLAVRSIFGDALPANATFVAEVEKALQILSERGAAATIHYYLKGTGL